MFLSARMLNSVVNVNSFDYADSVEFSQGDTIDCYFQLIDASKDKPIQNWKPAGRRFMPASGATLSVRVDNIDDNVAIQRSAVQAFPTSDPSIWKVSIVGSDVIRGTCALVLDLNQGGVHTHARVEGAIMISNQGTL